MKKSSRRPRKPVRYPREKSDRNSRRYKELMGSLIEAVMKDPSQPEHVHALRRLFRSAREAWLQAWVRRIRDKANTLAAVEFVVTSKDGDHRAGGTHLLGEMSFVSEDEIRVLWVRDAATYAVSAEPAEYGHLREVTGLRWSAREDLDRLVVEVRELCLTLYWAVLYERATGVGEEGLLPDGVSLSLNPGTDAPTMRCVLSLRKRKSSGSTT